MGGVAWRRLHSLVYLVGILAEETHFDLRRAFHHVVVRQDHPVFVDDESAA